MLAFLGKKDISRVNMLIQILSQLLADNALHFLTFAKSHLLIGRFIWGNETTFQSTLGFCLGNLELLSVT